MTAMSIAQAFSKNVIKHNGIPCLVVSDQNRIFLSTFWIEIFKLQGTLLKHSNSYHPKTEGQSEVVNRCL